MNRPTNLVLAVALALSACAEGDKAATQVQAAAQAQATPTLSTTDATFLDLASRAGIAEVTARDRYAGMLVGKHLAGIYRQRYGTQAALKLTRAAAAQATIDAEHLMGETLQAAFKVGHRTIFVNQQAFDLMEHPRMPGVDRIATLTEGLENVLGVREEAGADLCQLDAAARSFEEPLTKVAFERLDSGGHRGLGQKQCLGRAAKASLVCHLYECFKLS